MQILHHHRKGGFTLVELMVVIAIIAILTGIIITSLVGSKAKSRDAKRASDLSQISLAIEQFFDRCDQYPASLTLTAGGANICPNDANGNPIYLSNFISSIPNDPSGASSPMGNANYGYVTNPTNTDYILYTEFETTNSVLAQSAPNPSWYLSTSFDCSNQATTQPSPASNSGLDYCVRPN